MRTHTLSIFLAAAAGFTTHTTKAEVQSSRPIYELAGAVAVSVVANDIGDERSNRACDADVRDMERRVRFILNQTRLVLVEPVGLQAVERHPEYQRLLGQREATVRALPPSETSNMESHFRALQDADRPLEPWRHPLWLQVDMRPLAAGPQSCAQSITFRVNARIEATRVLSGRANTNTAPTVFSRSTLLLGPTSGAREQRGRVVEEFARDLANAWAEANR